MNVCLAYVACRNTVASLYRVHKYRQGEINTKSIEQTEIETSGQTALVLYEDLFMHLCYLHNSSLQLPAFLWHRFALQCPLYFRHTGSLLLGLGLHSLCNLFLLFLVQQMSSGCHSLLLKCKLAAPVNPWYTSHKTFSE